MRVSPRDNGVEPPVEIACDVLGGLPFPDTSLTMVLEHRKSAKLQGGQFKGHARPQGRLLEQQRDGAMLQGLSVQLGRDLDLHG